jgi:hypothetical protein
MLPHFAADVATPYSHFASVAEPEGAFLSKPCVAARTRNGPQMDLCCPVSPASAASVAVRRCRLMLLLRCVFPAALLSFRRARRGGYATRAR